MSATIHPTAYIHPTAIIYENVTIGENCYIGPYCVIGAPPEHPDLDPMTDVGKGVYIGNRCRLHGFNTIDSGIEVSTMIANNCVLMKGAHVGHDVQIWQYCVLSCGSRIGGHCVLNPQCNIGLNATIHQKSYLNSGTMVGASAFVKGEYHTPFRILVGVPAKDIGPNWRLMQKLGIKEQDV